MITLDKPLHVHDCAPDHCTFLGNYDDADLYTYQDLSGTFGYTARYSSDGPDYGTSSLTVIIASNEYLAEARRRHLARGVEWTDEDGTWRMIRPVATYADRVAQGEAILAEMDPDSEWATSVVLHGATLIVDRTTGVTIARINYR